MALGHFGHFRNVCSSCLFRKPGSRLGLLNHSMNIRIGSSIFDIRWFDRSNICWFKKVRCSIFDGSIDRMSGRFEEIRYSIRFDGSIFDGSIDRISQGFDKVRYSMRFDIRISNIEYRTSNHRIYSNLNYFDW